MGDVDSKRYYPTYTLRSGLGEYEEKHLKEIQGIGPLELLDVIEVCSDFQVEATLFDSAGKEIGKVSPDGNFELTG